MFDDNNEQQTPFPFGMMGMGGMQTPSGMPGMSGMQTPFGMPGMGGMQTPFGMPGMNGMQMPFGMFPWMPWNPMMPGMPGMQQSSEENPGQKEEAADPEGFELFGQNIPVEFLVALLNLEMSPEGLEKLQKFLDFTFSMMPEKK